MAEMTERKRDFTHHRDLKREYTTYWEIKHQDIVDYLYPEGGRIKANENYANDGKRRDTKILKSTARSYHRNLISGLYSGIANPTDKWFRLTIEDKDLKENSEVKEYFDEVTEILLSLLAKSNFYTTMKNIYADITAFGTAAAQIEADSDTVFRFTPFAIGEYFIDTDSKNRPEFISREFQMRAHNVIEEFGEENVSERVKVMVEGDKIGTEWVTILHVQKRNRDRDITRIDSKNKLYKSIYYEYNGKEDEPPLRESGNDTQPFIAPRWQVNGTDVWGTGPGDVVVGDLRQLMALVKDRMIAVKKSIKPALLANASSGDFTINASSNGITWTGGTLEQGQQPKVTPLSQPNLNLADLDNSIVDVVNDIKSALFADLFFLLAQANVQKTATEVLEAQEQNLRLIGPVMEQFTPEALIPVIGRAYDLSDKAGKLPDPPVIIRDMDVRVEIISLIAQAQKLKVVGPIEQTLLTVERLAQTWPEARDKINVYQAIDEIGVARGIKFGIINPDDVVAAINAAQEAELAAQQASANIQEAANTAHTLSQTDVSNPNALTAIAEGVQ